MNRWSNDRAATSDAAESADESFAEPASGPSQDNVRFWLVRTSGGTRLRPGISDYYTVRATTTTTATTPRGDASTARERLLVEADRVGIRELERALRESVGVQSVESEPAPDGDYLDEGHSAVVTLRGGRVVED
jgi:hypothetical protein